MLRQLGIDTKFEIYDITVAPFGQGLQRARQLLGIPREA